ncbi:MAG TPA: DUF1367 family protein [Paludibacter sp.]
MDYKAKYLGENVFEPLTSEDFKKSLKLGIGDFVELITWKERNVYFHRKYFALLNTTIYFLPEDEQFDRLRNIDYLRKEIMLLIGEVDIHVSFDGEMHMIPKSISFKSMDESKFQQIYSLSVNAILKTYLKNISIQNFEKYLLSFI